MRRQRHCENVGVIGSCNAGRNASASQRIRFWQWPNLLSLDAVSIGLLWQFVLTLEFCGRMPAWYESTIICLSIWLVYVADRLFDSMRIEPSQPHSVRHGFHLRYRNSFVVLWCVVLCANTFFVFRYPSYLQLRWGAVAVSAVCCYLMLAQCLTLWRERIRNWIQKEALAGLVFSFGVCLVAFSNEVDVVGTSLVLAWGLVSLLFAINCSIVAALESDIDRAQGFTSVATQFDSLARQLNVSLVVLAATALILFQIGLLEGTVGVSLAISALGMLFVMLAASVRGQLDGVAVRRERRVERAVLAIDFATLSGPAVSCLWIHWVRVG